MLDLDSAFPFHFFKSFPWQWLYLTLSINLTAQTNRQSECHWPLLPSLYQAKDNCEVKVLMLVWSWHQSFIPVENDPLCVSFNTDSDFMLLLTIHIHTQLLEASYLLFVSSSDFIYDITMRKALGWFLFEAMTLIIGYCIELYFRDSYKNKSQENLEQQGGPFYSEADYL